MALYTVHIEFQAKTDEEARKRIRGAVSRIVDHGEGGVFITDADDWAEEIGLVAPIACGNPNCTNENFTSESTNRSRNGSGRRVCESCATYPIA